MKKYQPLFAIIAITMLVGTAYNYAVGTSHAAATNSSKQQIPTRPDFSLPDLNGKIRHISEWNGKYIVLNFWATWCPPCRKEIPDFIILQDKYSNQLQFVGVAIDDAEAVRQFAFEMGINYPSLIAEVEGISLAKQYGNRFGALPFSAIINPAGKIIFQQVGILNEQKILSVTGIQTH